MSHCLYDCFLPLKLMAAGKKKKHHIMPGTKPLEKEALIQLIKAAEQGPFYTSAEIRSMLASRKKNILS
jgi:hypothetical protein